jgi:hypothetical protein
MLSADLNPAIAGPCPIQFVHRSFNLGTVVGQNISGALAGKSSVEQALRKPGRGCEPRASRLSEEVTF